MKIKQVKKSKFAKKVSLMLLFSVLGLNTTGCNQMYSYPQEIIVEDKDKLKLDLDGSTNVETLVDALKSENLENINLEINGFLYGDRLDNLISVINEKGLTAKSVEIIFYGYNPELIDALSKINSKSIRLYCYIDYSMDDIDMNVKLNDNTKLFELTFSSIVDVNTIGFKNISINTNSDIVNVSINATTDTEIKVPESSIENNSDNVMFLIENPIIKALNYK